MPKITEILIISLVMFSTCFANGCASASNTVAPQKDDANSVQAILTKLKQHTQQLKSYQTQVEYLFTQPIFDTKTLRKGVLYYAKFGPKSALRVDFNTVQRDDDQQQKHVEQIIFDGLQLVHIDHQIKQAKIQKIAEPNEPVDAFALISRNFPVVGFTKVEELEKQFEIKIVPPQSTEPNKCIHLQLITKKDSIYKDDYVSIDFYIDKKFIARVHLTPERLNPAAALHLNPGTGKLAVVEFCTVHGAWMNEADL